MINQFLDFVSKNKEITIAVCACVTISIIAAMALGYDVSFIPDIAYRLLNLK